MNRNTHLEDKTSRGGLKIGLKEFVIYRHYYLTRFAFLIAFPFIFMKWKADKHIKYRFGIPYGCIYGLIFGLIYMGIYGSGFGFLWGLVYGFIYGLSFGREYHSIYNDNLAFIYCIEFGLFM